ncbi:MAG TPA: T9SS type A sorting domain-containing protein [Bacteroides sp.]|nr:T9SS type A sorting domain-containing protein [Bacteroides sp.]
MLKIYYTEEPANVPSLTGKGQAALITYPNPFVDEISIIFRIDRKEKIHLGVYNLLGQQIEIITRGVQSPGRYHVKWDVTDRSGKAVPNGMYYIILDIGKDRQVTKIMKTR